MWPILLLEATLALSAPVKFERRSTFSKSTAHGPQNIQHFTFTIGETPYASLVDHSISLSTFSVPTVGANESLPMLATAIHGCSTEALDTFYEDDVWSPEFLENIYLLPDENCTSLSMSPRNQSVSILPSLQAAIPEGPYVIDKDVLYPVARLYRDTHEAFTTGLFKTGSDEFVEAEGNEIPVPSRLYYGPKTNEKPLNGVRVAVKDLFDIAGVRTGCGSRPYYETYGPAASNSYPVQRLINLGAVLVGKTIMCPFANTGWAEQLEPFNPRGDGYRNPSGSSTGSGAAIAAYEWLDAAIGSDTGGSIRGPAGASGVQGIRPTFGIMNLTGVMPMSDILDTPGFFTRDASSFFDFGKAWYGLTNNTKRTAPIELLTPADFWKNLLPKNHSELEPALEPQSKIYRKFLDQFKSFSGLNETKTSFEFYWNAMTKVNETISSYANETYAVLIAGYQHQAVGSPFNKTYHDKNHRAPFFDPSVLARWSWMQSQPNGTYEKHVSRKQLFTDFMQKVLPDDCSRILVYPANDGEPSLRQSYPGTPVSGPPVGFGATRLANLGSLPDMVIPLGEVPYNSTITHSQEWLPVSLSIVGGSGCDIQLMDIAKQLESSGLIKPVNTGRSLWDH